MNIVVIVCDSWRKDFTGFYGNRWIKTPNIDALASESTVFNNAYCEGIPTIPTRIAMFTGRFTFPFRGWGPLSPADITLAKVLWDRGFETALITDTMHMNNPKVGVDNFSCGFDHVEFIKGQEPMERYVLDPNIKVDVEKYHKDDGTLIGARNRAYLEKYLKIRAMWKSEEDYPVARVCKAGMRWLESKPEEDRLFLWLDCFDPHQPWDPPSPWNRMYDPNYDGKDIIQPCMRETKGYLTDREIEHIRALAAGKHTFVDRWVGKFISKIKDLDILDNTLLIFTSDHGVPLGEHGIIRKARPWPYEETARIPLMIRHPEGVGKGKRVNAFVETCDIAPTILDFLDIDIPPTMNGSSLMPLVTGEKEKVRDYGYSGYYSRSWKIRYDKWSYILWLGENAKKPELYNLEIDPREEKNLIDEEPEIADKLELQLKRFVSSLSR